jgi:hypothetical protein
MSAGNRTDGPHYSRAAARGVLFKGLGRGDLEVREGEIGIQAIRIAVEKRLPGLDRAKLLGGFERLVDRNVPALRERGVGERP